jgi:hypothetical protein
LLEGTLGDDGGLAGFLVDRHRSEIGPTNSWTPFPRPDLKFELSNHPHADSRHKTTNLTTHQIFEQMSKEDHVNGEFLTTAR